MVAALSQVLLNVPTFGCSILRAGSKTKASNRFKAPGSLPDSQVWKFENFIPANSSVK